MLVPALGSHNKLRSFNSGRKLDGSVSTCEHFQTEEAQTDHIYRRAVNLLREKKEMERVRGIEPPS